MSNEETKPIRVKNETYDLVQKARKIITTGISENIPEDIKLILLDGVDPRTKAYTLSAVIHAGTQMLVNRASAGIKVNHEDGNEEQCLLVEKADNASGSSDEPSIQEQRVFTEKATNTRARAKQ